MTDETPQCPECDTSLVGEIPVAIRDEDAGQNLIEISEVRNGVLVAPGYVVCPGCDEKIYYAGAEEIAKEEE